MRSATRTHLVMSLFAIGIALALGWLAQRFPVAFDVTSNARHSLSGSTLATLEALDAPVHITAVLGPDGQVRDAVEQLVARYRAIRPDISLEFLNPERNPARARELDAAPGGELILEGGGRTRRLQRLDERSLTGALRQIGREGTHSIAFVGGHGERSPVAATNDDYSLAAERLAAIGLLPSEHSFVTEPRVPDSVDVLVVAAPRRSWFPGEIAGLVEYVRSGGSLLWLIETPTDGPAADGSLSELATELGVDTLPGIVIDTASQALSDGSPDFVVLSSFPDHPVTRALASPVLLPQAHALSVTPLAGQDTRVLLVTPAESWTESGALEGEVRHDADAGEIAGPLVLGATIERDIGGRDQRIALVGDADFGASRFLGNGANAAFLESLLVWLAGDDQALEFVTKPASDATLVLGSRAIIGFSVLCLVVLPGLLLTGALVARLRARRA